MRFKPVLVFTALALAGVTAAVAAEHETVHHMVVHLPDGSVEQISYTGDVAPRVVLTDAAAPLVPAPFLDTAFGGWSPFADLQRISAEMDQRMSAMMHQVALAQAAASDPAMQQAVMTGAPAGVTSFTSVSTFTGNGGCTQSVRVTGMGEGKAPQVIRTSSGDCSAAKAPQGAVQNTAHTAPKQPAPIDPDSI